MAFKWLMIAGLVVGLMSACNAQISASVEERVEVKQISKPLRIPEGVVLRKAEPSKAKAGEVGSWVFTFVVSKSVASEEKLWLHVYGGRHSRIAWPGLQTSDENAPGYVTLSTDSGERLQPADGGVHGVIPFAVPKEGIGEGRSLTAEFTDVSAPKLTQDGKFILVLKSPKNANDLGRFSLNEKGIPMVVGACLIDIVGGDLTALRAYGPSYAAVGKPISIFIKPEDLHRNVAGQAPGKLIIRLKGKEISAQRKDVPDANSCMLEGVVLPEEGVHRLEIEDLSNGIKTLTNPIKCVENSSLYLLWGHLHGHTELSDGTGTIDNYYSSMRDACGLDFGAAGDHDHAWETSDEMWRMNQKAVIKYNDPGHFTTFLGYEWAKWRRNGDGDRNVYYLHDNRPMYRSENDDYPTPADLFKALADETAMIIPHHPAEVGNHCDWKDHHPEKERLVEIYSYWGCSERSVNQGNPFPVKGPDKTKLDSGEVQAGFVQRALELGWRVGFIAGSDDHMGHPGDMAINANEPWDYQGGLTAVYAGANNRESLWKGLWDRHCYGTTGARMIVDFRLDEHPMGSVLRLSDWEKWASARRLSVTVHGTAEIESIEIVRNNEDVHVLKPNALNVRFDWADDDPLKDVNLPPALYSPEPYTFYYLRVRQKDGEMAWVSPIWILSGDA